MVKIETTARVAAQTSVAEQTGVLKASKKSFSVSKFFSTGVNGIKEIWNKFKAALSCLCPSFVKNYFAQKAKRANKGIVNAQAKPTQLNFEATTAAALLANHNASLLANQAKPTQANFEATTATALLANYNASLLANQAKPVQEETPISTLGKVKQFFNEYLDAFNG